MNPNIPGVMDTAALAKLRFWNLTVDEQANAIRSMADSGQGDHTIASATGLIVEYIRKVLSRRRDCPASRIGR
jgi:hypothetical protein